MLKKNLIMYNTTHNTRLGKFRQLIFVTLIILASFGGGYAFNNYINNSATNNTTIKKVTGIGGIFFKCKNPKLMREWYSQHLGFEVNPYGAVFEWYHGADSTKKGFTNWSPFSEKSKYFEPSTKDYMINYRVANLPALIAILKTEGVTIADSMETYDYGKFVHIIDVEGNKVELWEPNDIEYEKLGAQFNSKTIK
jgi:predicted enzyme related to lactoylglutathione lyase